MRTVIWEDGKCTEECDEEDCALAENNAPINKKHDV